MKVAIIFSFFFSVGAFADLASLEKKLNEQVDTIYCSAILEFIDSNKKYNQEKSHKLIKNADLINKSLPPEQRVDVIQSRNKYIKKLIKNNTSKENASDLYDYLKCDLRV